jgi:hypothetical protein
MAIGSFVDGVFRGMQARDTMDNNKRLRKMEDTRFEREGEKHGWDRQKHELAMKRANKKRGPSRGDIIASETADYGRAPESTTAPAGGPPLSFGGMSIMDAVPRNGPPLSFGTPVEMSALPAANIPQQPMRLAYDPQRGLIPETMA